MGGYPPYSGFTEVSLAIGVILSAIISLVGTAARRRSIALGEARLSDLAEMTGILDPKQLIAVFGPPDMERVWRTVTLTEVRRARRPLGWLMSSDLVDFASIALAVLALWVDYWLMPIGLLTALGIQMAGWVVAARVPK